MFVCVCVFCLNSILQLPSAYLPLNPEVPPVQTVKIIDRCKLTYCVIQNILLQVETYFSACLSGS